MTEPEAARPGESVCDHVQMNRQATGHGTAIAGAVRSIG
jgi:hypothetical protein